MAASASAQNISELRPQTDHDGPKRRVEGSKAQSGGGRCGYRELTSGIECGCQTFWAGSPQDISACACGHHACFHSSDGPVGRLDNLQTTSATSKLDLNASLMAHLAQLGRIISQVAPVTNSRPEQPSAVRETDSSLPRIDQDVQSQVRVVANRPDQNAPSPANTSYQPRIPSGLILSQAADTSTGHDQALGSTNALPSTGLGLWLNGVASVSGSLKGRDVREAHGISDGMLPSFNLPSLQTTQRSTSVTPDVTGVHHQLLPALDVPLYHNFPGFEDLIQSATEANTPSIGSQTPDPNIPSARVRPSTEYHNRRSPNQMPPPIIPRISAGAPTLASSKKMTSPGSQQLVSPPPMLLNESQSVQEVASQLQALRKYMTQQAAQLRGLADRLDLMERTSSFSQAPRDQELLDKLDLVEARVMDVENKMEDAHAAALDTSSWSVFRKRQTNPQNPAREKNSTIPYRSSQSINSNDSSAAILAGTRDAIKIRMDGLDERVADIEKSMPPSISRPLEVEVILLPWGRMLHGVWSASTFQDTQDWMSLPSSSRMSASWPSGGVSGWSHEAIHDWADDSEEWLVPRACSTKSVVYSRLKSRGFVKTIELSRPGALEVQQIIVRTFADVLTHLNIASQDEGGIENACDSIYLGLTAPFIPLRKVHRSSELRFLAKTEMLTSALWTAEFFISSAMMHAAGGLKRLFITHKEAYFQRPDAEAMSWTWQRIRELPRAGSQSTEEGDAREACWAEHPNLDIKVTSANASFGSHVSSISIRSKQTHDSTTHEAIREGIPTEVDDGVDVKSEDSSDLRSGVLPTAERPFAPITPVTEQDLIFTPDARDNMLDVSVSRYGPNSDEDVEPPSTSHPTQLQLGLDNRSTYQQRYNLRRHSRNSSNPPIGEARSNNALHRSAWQPIDYSVLTRSFSTPSNPLIATLPSFVPSSPNIPQTRPSRRRAANQPTSSGSKRRRIDRSVSAEDAASYRAFQRRSRSMSAAEAATKKGKRSMTPIGPYLTPFSGNFASSHLDTGPGGSESKAESDDEVWEGLGGCDEESVQDVAFKDGGKTAEDDDDEEVGEDSLDDDDDDSNDFDEESAFG